MIVECKTWQERSEVEALKFSDEVWRLFERCLLASSQNLPKNTSDNRAMLLNIYFDALISSLALVTASYSGDMSGRFEDSVIEGLRGKFTELRTRNLGGKGKMGRLKISDEEKT